MIDLSKLSSLPIKALRDGYGETLVKLGKEDPKIVCLDGDLMDSTRMLKFAKEFPKRFFEIGIAEQDMIGTATGMAFAGMTPFASTFAAFVTRCFDQLRYTLAYPRANVKFVVTHAGLGVGEDGASAHAINDIALMRSIQNFTVIVPSDYTSTKMYVDWAAKYHGPVFIRLTRQDLPVLYEKESDYAAGKANVLTDGSDLAIIACGAEVYEALAAAAELAKRGVKAKVVDSAMIKPLDHETILKVAKETGHVLTCEDHSIIGGLGGAVSEFLSENYPVPVHRIGLRDIFALSGTPRELFDYYGLSYNHIVDAAVAMKNGHKK